MDTGVRCACIVPCAPKDRLKDRRATYEGGEVRNAGGDQRDGFRDPPVYSGKRSTPGSTLRAYVRDEVGMPTARGLAAAEVAAERHLVLHCTDWLPSDPRMSCDCNAKIPGGVGMPGPHWTIWVLFSIKGASCECSPSSNTRKMGKRACQLHQPASQLSRRAVPALPASRACNRLRSRCVLRGDESEPDRPELD